MIRRVANISGPSIAGGLVIIALLSVPIYGLAAGINVQNQLQASGPSIKFTPGQSKERPGKVEVGPFPLPALATVTAGNLSYSEFTQFFFVHVLSADDSSVPMLGSYSVVETSIIFTPRFPLVASIKYEAQFDLTAFARRFGASDSGGTNAERYLKQSFTIKKVEGDLAAKVTRIYPSSNVLPANQLKIYIHFSSTMSFGDAYDHIHLLDEVGNQVPRPFLIIDQELWDATHERFTLLFDPGRIKRDLKSNLDLGPPLIAGKKYKLVIDKAWRDGSGNQLDSDFVKEFVVSAPVRTPLDYRKWRVDAPSAGTIEPVKVNFGKPLDRALMESMITVCDANGKQVEGHIDISDDETQWRFRPMQPWRTADYSIRINSKLEDLAGNNLKNIFDVDLRENQIATRTTDFVNIPFSIEPHALEAEAWHCHPQLFAFLA